MKIHIQLISVNKTMWDGLISAQRLGFYQFTKDPGLESRQVFSPSQLVNGFTGRNTCSKSTCKVIRSVGLIVLLVLTLLPLVTLFGKISVWATRVPTCFDLFSHKGLQRKAIYKPGVYIPKFC